MTPQCPKCKQTLPIDGEPPTKELVCSSCGTAFVDRSGETVTFVKDGSNETYTFVAASESTSAPASVEPYSRSFGDYEIIEPIAEGGMGAVYSGNAYHSALRMRVDMPDLRSTDLAERLTTEMNLDPPVTGAGFRKLVQRARAMFAELLVYEVSQTIESTDPTRIEDELIDLGLRQYCKGAI